MMRQAWIPVKPELHLDPYCLHCAIAAGYVVEPLENRGDMPAENLKCVECGHQLGDDMDIYLQAFCR